MDEMLTPYPAMLPMEVAMRTAPIARICEAYGIDQYQWEAIKTSPHFRRAVKDAKAQLDKDGWSFRMKAKAMAEEFLKVTWVMVHDQGTPNAVRADLIKHVNRCAGYDTPVPDSQHNNAFQININLG